MFYFKNTSASSDLNYLIQSIPSSIVTSLLQTDKFIIIRDSVWKKKIDEMGKTIDNLSDPDFVLSLARSLNADAAII